MNYGQDEYYGWGPPDATDQERLDLAREMFDLVSSREPRIQDYPLPSPNIKKFMCWWASRKLFNGKDILHTKQFSGSCVGASAGNVLNYTQVIEIVLGQPEELKYIFFPYHYGIGRKLGGMNSKGNGSNGGPQSEAILKYGCIPDDLEGLPKVTKSDVNWMCGEATEMDWSGRDRDGTWDYQKYESEGKKHLIQSARRITNFDDAAKAILNGYMIQVCSNMGYGRLDSDGFNKQNTSWNHAMLIGGTDIGYKEPYGVIINSWGDAHERIKDFETEEQFPIGCLRVRASHIDRMLRQNDSYAYSGLSGFPARDLTRAMFDLV